MKTRITIIFTAIIIMLGNANAIYELCDSMERDSNAGLFTCHITSTQYNFSQQDIDSFWENVQKDGDYLVGRMKVVEWKIKATVIQVADDLRFIQPEQVNLAWDITLEGDANTTHDLNTADWRGTIRPTNHTAIKKKMGAMQEYLISFAPIKNQRSIRNLTLEKPDGALAVYISGSNIKKMNIMLEGDLTLDGGYLENIETLKARNITLDNEAYIQDAENIDAENITLENGSFITDVGHFGETSMRVRGKTGLVIKTNSYIEELRGGLEAISDINISENSRLENLEYAPSEVIQWIKANNLKIEGQSKIRGIGGKPGEITLTGKLEMEDSAINGKEEYKPTAITAKTIEMKNNSKITNFTEHIIMTGEETATIESGSSIEKFSGTINSCAPIMLDGNSTKLHFTKDAKKEIRAPSLDLNGEAKIICTGQEECDYSFVEQDCGVMPETTLATREPPTGKKPLTVEFEGNCNGFGTPITCTLDFGDQNTLDFETYAIHEYENNGVYKAILTAKNSREQESKSMQTITVKDEAGPGQTPVTATAQKTSISPGESLLITIECTEGISDFNIQNNMGLETGTETIEACPKTLGPYETPENLEEGTYNITITGTTASGQPYQQNLEITVSKGITGLPIDPTTLIIYAAGTILILALGATLVILIKKKKTSQPKSKAKNEAREEEVEEWKPASSDEKPPWINEEDSEEKGLFGKEKSKKEPAKKPLASEKKTITLPKTKEEETKSPSIKTESKEEAKKEPVQTQPKTQAPPETGETPKPREKKPITQMFKLPIFGKKKEQPEETKQAEEKPKTPEATQVKQTEPKTAQATTLEPEPVKTEAAAPEAKQAQPIEQEPAMAAQAQQPEEKPVQTQPTEPKATQEKTAGQEPALEPEHEEMKEPAEATQEDTMPKKEPAKEFQQLVEKIKASKAKEETQLQEENLEVKEGDQKAEEQAKQAPEEKKQAQAIYSNEAKDEQQDSKQEEWQKQPAAEKRTQEPMEQEEPQKQTEKQTNQSKEPPEQEELWKQPEEQKEQVTQEQPQQKTRENPISRGLSWLKKKKQPKEQPKKEEDELPSWLKKDQ